MHRVHPLHAYACLYVYIDVCIYLYCAQLPGCSQIPTGGGARDEEATSPLRQRQLCLSAIIPPRAIARKPNYACCKAFALTWYRALTWYSSPARPVATLDVPLLVTRQQGSPSPACRQLSRARNVCAGGSSEGSTKLGHGTKLGPTLCYVCIQECMRAHSWRLTVVCRVCRRL